MNLLKNHILAKRKKEDAPRTEAEIQENLERLKTAGVAPQTMRWLIFLWIFTLIISIVLGILSFVSSVMNEEAVTRWIMAVTGFANFIATSFFSVSIYNHNATVRESNIIVRQQSEETSRRAELFRNLQFAAANYSIADFVESMTIYEEYPRYREKLRNSMDFHFHLTEESVTAAEVAENFDGFTFLSVRIPLTLVEGKSIGRFSIKTIKIEKEEQVYRFVPPENKEKTDVLIIYDEIAKRQEAVFNLIIRRDSDFYSMTEINPFLKIKFRVVMESLLGVSVSGIIELYFTNPEKIEKSGASKYKINSSQFEASGLPELNYTIHYDM